MSTFMDASQEENGIGIPDFKRPCVEDTLRSRSEATLKKISYYMRTSMLRYPLLT